MIGERRFEIFKLFGFPIRIDASWIIILFLVTFSLAEGYFPANHKGLPTSAYWAMGFVAAIGLFLSILFHELSHALMARHYKIKIEGITLFIFGGVAEMREESPSPKIEFWVSVLGPVASIFLALVFFRLSSFLAGLEANRAVVLILYYLGFMNALLAIFNLVPAFPLDGGRIFRSILWAVKKDYVWATKIAAYCGQGFGWILVGLGAYSFIRGNFLGGFWYVLIGFFLRRASQMSMKQVLLQKKLEGLSVSQLMDHEFLHWEPRDRLIDVVHALEHRSLQSHYPILESGRLVGALSILKLNELKGAGWEYKEVGDLLDPNYLGMTVDPQANAWAAFQKMRSGRLSNLFVLDQGRMSGLVTMEKLINQIRAGLQA